MKEERKDERECVWETDVAADFTAVAEEPSPDLQ